MGDSLAPLLAAVPATPNFSATTPSSFSSTVDRRACDVTRLPRPVSWTCRGTCTPAAILWLSTPAAQSSSALPQAQQQSSVAQGLPQASGSPVPHRGSSWQASEACGFVQIHQPSAFAQDSFPIGNVSVVHPHGDNGFGNTMVPPSCNVAVGHYLDRLLEFTLSSITSLASTASCSSLVSPAYQPSFYQSFTCSLSVHAFSGAVVAETGRV